MEIVYQNKREDLEAFYDYFIKETMEGKRISMQAFLIWSAFAVFISVLAGLIEWSIFREWQTTVGTTIVFLSGSIVFTLAISGFQPIYHAGREIYRRKVKSITAKELQVFQLPKTIIIDDDWLEARNSEAVYRWRWRQIDQLGITHSFIFVLISNQLVAHIPKRDFQTEQDFVDFGKRLTELTEKHKNEPIGL